MGGRRLALPRWFARANHAFLAVELPVVFELAVNLATARALGLTIPESLILRADAVIG